jgi:hypothetical protein
MGDGAARIPIIGEPSPGSRGRGSIGLAGASHDDDALAEFKRTVRERQIEYLVNVKKRTFFPDIPEKELEKVEETGKHRMRREAALACRELLAAARAALAAAQGTGDRSAGRTSSIGIQSAYRNLREDSTFNDYYKEMVEKQTYAGNELGTGALEYMLQQMISFKAPPGYSNHSNGMAVDFNTVHDKTTYQAKKKQNDGWKRTWLHRWLVQQAGSYGFKPLATEAWHWDFDPSLRRKEQK